MIGEHGGDCVPSAVNVDGGVPAVVLRRVGRRFVRREHWTGNAGMSVWIACTNEKEQHEV